MAIGLIDFWYWWIAGLVLIAIEVFMPGTFFLWMGVAAGVVGVVLLVDPSMSLDYQLLIFAAVSVGAVAAWRLFLRTRPPVTDEPALNRRGSQYLGRVFVLSAAIDNGVGTIRVDDTIWKVAGPDLPAGAKVRVTGVDGTILLVEPAAADA